MTQPQVYQLLVQLAISLSGAFLASYLTMHFTLKRFYRERLWERKAEAYTVVFSGLHDMLEWHNEHLDAYLSGHEMSAERQNDLQTRYRKAREDIRRRVAAETWLLDAQVGKHMHTMWRELHSPKDDFFSDLEESSAAIDKARNHILEISKSDLQLEGQK